MAQTPDIVSFPGSGILAWTNANAILFYRIEWASSTSVHVWPVRGGFP
jgi:hypothetical protein